MICRTAVATVLVLGAAAFRPAAFRPAPLRVGGAARGLSDPCRWAARASRGGQRGAAALQAAEASAPDAPPRCARRFEFVPYGEAYAGGERSICADGLVQGADLHLTHWSNNKVSQRRAAASCAPHACRRAGDSDVTCVPPRPSLLLQTPMEYKADLSTEIVFKWLKLGAAAKYPSREFLDAVVLNNHFDTDGLMSAWALLEPDKALQYESVMVAAAAAGDFEEWDLSDRGMILDIAFSKLAQEAGSDKAAYEELLPKVEELLQTIPKQPHLWQDELAALERAFDLVCDDVIKVSRLEDNKSKFNHAQGDVGDIGIFTHPKDTPCVPGPGVCVCVCVYARA